MREKELAARLQIDRRQLAAFRKKELTAGADWVEEQGLGIFLTAEGEQKIKAAWPAPELEPEELPAAPAVVTITIRRLCPNRLVVEGEPIEGQRVLVRLLRGPSPNYRPGMALEGCSRRPGYAEQWDYPGPKPRFTGRF